MANFDIKTFDGLFDAVLKLKNVEDCRRFFEDVCTIKELQDISQRLEVAKLLNVNRNELYMSYLEYKNNKEWEYEF